jgi:hypothetical protein
VTAAPNAARFYGDDTRRINRLGIERTMHIFFDHFMERSEAAARGAGVTKLDIAAEARSASRIICDEEAIDAA